ncbi:MAG: hypothetical protein CVV23_08135 [Ignavibacteriae bacterium HGW-Ignavibacteriae-2]|jgi:methyl-accepting chemotaxis protein|nr:MAG: hypothetical protein CVV23_08135 [Ignavibacteriae bacterium HGW-Ignavibacteriae-2]
MYSIKLWKKSIRAKLIITFSFLLLSISVFNYSFNYSTQKADFKNYAENHLKTLSEMLAFSVGAGLAESNFDIVQAAFSWAKSDTNVIYISIIDETNTCLVTHNPNNISVQTNKVFLDKDVVWNENYMSNIAEIKYKEKMYGHIVMAYSFDKMNNQLLARSTLSNTVSLIIFLSGFGIVLIISTFFTKQIKHLKDTAVRVGNGDLSVEVNVKSKDEVGLLAEAIKTMTTQIKETSDSLMKEKSKAELATRTAEIQRNLIEEKKNYLSKKINQILEEMNKFASGDLTIKLVAEKNDEIGKLFEGFNNAVINTREMILSVSEAVSATARTSSEISSSAEEVAAGAQKQGTQASEVAMAVKEMTSNLLQTTKNAGSAAEFSEKAGSSARKGGEVVKHTFEGMNRIAEVVENAAATIKKLGSSSNKIGEIIQVIEDIADQTNLLALNAAIEAARAGEQGRGFVVVADEVRKLAERTTKATKAITAMVIQIQNETGNAIQSIENGTEQVETGKHLTQKAIEALDEIIYSTNDTIDMVNQVAAASEEQSSTVEQMNKNILYISNVAQESATGIQQIALASEGLTRMTTNLQKLISRFTVNVNYSKRYSVKSDGNIVES